MKILSSLKFLFVILLFIFIEPYYILKILLLKKQNNNSVINYLKNIKSIFKINNINIIKLYRYCFLFNNYIFQLNNCLINNGALFTFFKKFITADIKLKIGLKKNKNIFKGHCIPKLNNHIIINSQNHNEWTEVITI